MPSTICLNMIVKDEAHIIEKTLRNILDKTRINYWVICDTGSSDNTIEIIEKVFSEAKIEGEIHRHEWKDFSHNRNLALDAARDKADYLLIFDADDEIRGNFNVPDELTHDMYHVIFGGGFAYQRGSIINNKKRWRFKGVLHEVIMADEDTGPAETITGDYYFVSGRTGNRNKNPNKYLDDAKILEKAFADPEEHWLKARYAFYCAQSYKDAGNKLEAIKWYKETLEQDGWIQEKYCSAMYISQLCFELNMEAEAVYYCLQTLQYDPKRWEGVYHAIHYYLDKGDDNTAVMMMAGLDINNPINPRDDGKLFIDEALHDYRMLMDISIHCANNGKKEQGRKAIHNLYKNVDHLPDAVSGNTLFNSQFYPSSDITIAADHFEKTIQFFNKILTKRPSQHCDPGSVAVLDNLMSQYRNALCDWERPSVTLRTGDLQHTIITMTTCKRISLFRRTMDSIIRCWNDLDQVDQFICVDDGSSSEDLAAMAREYPWIQIVCKSEDKGHRGSMNQIHNIVINSGAKYWIHMEDDWEFIIARDYVKESIKFLDKQSENGIKQVLFNKCYAEIIHDLAWSGGKPIADGFLEHVINEGPCGYWPHFSFRPSMVMANILEDLGNFDSPNTFFELDYANKYVAKGYKSAYFDAINCLHIGKLAGPRGNKKDKNAYELNDLDQGIGRTLHKSKVHVINLLRRQDRLNSVKQKIGDAYAVKVIEATDGLELKEYDARLKTFEGNDFGSNSGAIGCALSHMRIWETLLHDKEHDYYIVMEDDISHFKEGWKNELDTLDSHMKETEFLFLGHHMYEAKRNANFEEFNGKSESRVVDLDSSLTVGGFFCYSINKDGARKAIDLIHTHGCKHGIDYLIMKACPDIKCKEVRPHLAFSPWKEGSAIIDTDIQNFTHSLEYKSVHSQVPLYCFIHSCHVLEHGLTRLKSLIDKIKGNNLFHILSRIYVCNIGAPITEDLGDKIITIQLSSDIKYFESATLNYMRDFARENGNAYILYMHTKGLSRLHDACTNDWIDLMTYFLIDKHEVCINALEKVCAAGVNWQLKNWQRNGCGDHFSGNFWWATASHIAKQSLIDKGEGEILKMKAEWWMTLPTSNQTSSEGYKYHDNGDGFIILELHNSGVNHFVSRYPGKHHAPYITNVDGFKVSSKIIQSSPDRDSITRVKIIGDWNSSSNICREFGNMGKTPGRWNDICLVSEKPYDYLVVINRPYCDVVSICTCHTHDEMQDTINPQRTIVMQMEPWCEGKSWGANSWGKWSNPNVHEFLSVIGRHSNTYNNAFWQLELSYNELTSISISKTRKFSTICSNKYFDPGHIKRIDFIKFLQDKNDEHVKLDVFSQKNSREWKHYKGAVTPYIDKSHGLIPYEYYFMVENNFESGFITEKLWEPILCECLVFYQGAPDVAKYIDPEAFVLLDMDDFEGSYQLIKKAIAENWREKRLPAIKRMKDKILNEMQFFPRIEKIITNHKANLISTHAGINMTIDYIPHESLVFYHGYDIHGHDIERIHASEDMLKKQSFTKYKDRCIAFNTLGFIKSSLGDQLLQSSWFGDDDGVWIKKKTPTNDNEDNKQIVIITPSYRVQNLKKLYESIDFTNVLRWIIVYDGKHIEENQMIFKDNPKIDEYVYAGDSCWGNGQRNYALDKLTSIDAKFFVYFLDDDNIMHPDFDKIIPKLEYGHLYTFDQLRLGEDDVIPSGGTLPGNIIKYRCIDTAQFIADFALVRDIRWRTDVYQADFFYINECCVNNYKNHEYIPLVASYWNYLHL